METPQTHVRDDFQKLLEVYIRVLPLGFVQAYEKLLDTTWPKVETVKGE